MFTGLIEQVGRIETFFRSGNSYRLFVGTEPWREPLRIGDSVAVNGICLTAVDIETQGFWADAMPETATHSTLSNWRIRQAVNLERALPLQGRLDGHLVTGHVDCTGRLREIKRDEVAYRLTIEIPRANAMYVAAKGSVAIDGVSLTVTAVTETTFYVSLIPYSWRQTAFADLHEGDFVNVETDIISKYIARFLQFQIPKQQEQSTFTDVLRGNGFIR